MADVISIIADNQSTITVDSLYDNKRPNVTGINSASYDGPETYPVTRKVGMIVGEARINAMENVKRVLGQFGYWGNDEYTFHDGNRWGVCRVFISNNPDPSDLLNCTDYLAMDVWFALPNLVLGEEGHENAAENLIGGTRGQDVRNSQWAMAKLIAQQLNYYATEVGSTLLGMTVANGATLDEPIVNSVAGPWGVDLSTIWGGGGADLKFVPCDSGDAGGFTPHTQPYIYAECQTGGNWRCDFIFMDYYYTFYNSRSGAFATGAGYPTQSSEFPFVANAGWDGVPYEKRWTRMDYISSVAGHPVADFKAAYLDAFQELYLPSELAIGGDLSYNLKTKSYYLFPRSTSMIGSRYYMYESLELMEARKMDTTSNTKEVKDVLNFLPAYGYDRGVWQEYAEDYYAPSIYIDSSMAYQSLSFQLVNDSRDAIFAATAESAYDDLPGVPSNAAGFVSLNLLEEGAIYGLPEVNSVIKYSEKALTLPAAEGQNMPLYFADRGVRCPPGTSIVCFSSAKSL